MTKIEDNFIKLYRWKMCYNHILVHYSQRYYMYVYSLRHMWPWTTLALLLIGPMVYLLLKLVTMDDFGSPVNRPYGLLAPKTLKLFGFPIFWFWASPDEGYSRNLFCALNLISTFLLQRNSDTILTFLGNDKNTTDWMSE